LCDTNPQNNTSKADNEIYAQNYGDDFSDYIEFASENYGDGNLADSNNKNLGNTPAEITQEVTFLPSLTPIILVFLLLRLVPTTKSKIAKASS
jgi:hypothetical protein